MNVACEHCAEEFPVGDMEMMGMCWVCQRCVAEWRTVFEACEHEWEPETDAMGDAGQYCSKCCSFVANEHFPHLFGKPAPGA